MSRPVRIEFPGAHYYVTSKGHIPSKTPTQSELRANKKTQGQAGSAGTRAPADGRVIFADDDDRAEFLKVLEAVVMRFGWQLFGYTLLDNHYHLVLACPQANLSKGMRQLNGVYTQHFNRRHEQDGALFQGRFRSVLFEPANYLLPLCRHAVLNPVRVGASNAPQSYRWSSYRATAGVVQRPAWLDSTAVLDEFGRDADARKGYRDYIKAGIGAPSPLNDRSAQVLLGSPRFVNEMQPILNGEKLAKRGPQSVQRRRSLPVLFKHIEEVSRAERNRLILKAHIDHGYTLMDIGECLGLHYTTVSKIVNHRQKARG